MGYKKFILIVNPWGEVYNHSDNQEELEKDIEEFSGILDEGDTLSIFQKVKEVKISRKNAK